MSTVLRAWADDAAEMARVISGQDPARRAETFPLAGGRAVLWGAGLYVNRAMADSERHLRRNGFRPRFEIRTLGRDSSAEPARH